MLLPETCDPSTLPSFDNAMTVTGTFTNNDQVVLACASNFGTDAAVTCRCDTTAGGNNMFTCTANGAETTNGPTCSPSKKQTFKTFYFTLCITLKRVKSFRCPS